jgi:hypothetical protein
VSAKDAVARENALDYSKLFWSNPAIFTINGFHGPAGAGRCVSLNQSIPEAP